MNQFEIPKEIKTKPKLLGLEIKEMGVLLVVTLLSLTFFKDMIHGFFVIPYFIVVVGLLFYLFIPSSTNPQKKNFHALYLLLKRDKATYYAMDIHISANEALAHQVRSQNEGLITHERAAVVSSEDIEMPIDSTIEEVSEYAVQKNERTTLSKAVAQQVSEVGDVDEKKKDAVPMQNATKQVEEFASLSKQKSTRKKGWGMMLKLFTHQRVHKQLVPALRHFGMQEYDAALVHFEKITFNRLDKQDQDMMLLTYLFTDQAEQALTLMPEFAETVVNYYKVSDDMDKIRQLAIKVKSRVLEFEVAVANENHWKVIELKDFVEANMDRHFAVAQAYLALEHLDKARQYAYEINNEALITYVKAIIDKDDSVETLLPEGTSKTKAKHLMSFTRNDQGNYSFLVN